LLIGKAADKLRLDPRKSWYRNLTEVTTNGDHEEVVYVPEEGTSVRPGGQAGP